jgi:hypothetical protein
LFSVIFRKRESLDTDFHRYGFQIVIASPSAFFILRKDVAISPHRFILFI